MYNPVGPENKEWIELYNNTTSTIDLIGWKIKKSGEDFIEFSTSVIPGPGYYLLERTDDDSVFGISADFIYTGALKNTGENLELINSSGELIDFIGCSAGWFAGDNSAKNTMEKIGSAALGNDAANWASSILPGGTPKAENSVSL